MAGARVRFGAHLPLMDLGGQRFAVDHLVDYVESATALGFEAGLDVMSGGRVVAALGPGSSSRDYATVGVPFEERWPRFDEAVSATRALLRGDSFDGHFYAVEGPLVPLPTQPDGPPLWVGSWGSEAGLRRAVRLADGWLASAYNFTPEQFRERWDRVRDMLGEAGREAADLANGVATM